MEDCDCPGAGDFINFCGEKLLERPAENGVDVGGVGPIAGVLPGGRLACCGVAMSRVFILVVPSVSEAGSSKEGGDELLELSRLFVASVFVKVTTVTADRLSDVDLY